MSDKKGLWKKIKENPELPLRKKPSRNLVRIPVSYQNRPFAKKSRMISTHATKSNLERSPLGSD